MSVDLDEIRCYAAIHGLTDAEAPDHAIYDHAVPRFEALFAAMKVPATFFVVGDDLERPENGSVIARLHRAGHEVANHSWHHLYRFSREPNEVVLREIEGAQERIEAVIGERPAGFRAPGYLINDRVFACLAELGLAWDSSVFPCPAYYSAKAVAIALKALVGRRSHSIVEGPHVLRAPSTPYRVGKPYYSRSRKGEIIELPIGVTPLTRLPFIGTSLTLAGETGARWLTHQMVGKAFVNLELHGIDLADKDQDGLKALAPHQPDLRRPVEAKLTTLRSTIEHLQENHYRFVTLSEAAKLMFPSQTGQS